jgi:membrane-associated phospholipid phosphatase
LKRLVYSGCAIERDETSRRCHHEASDLIAHIGNLGHSALILPASILLLAALLGWGRKRDALAFAVALTACLAITLVAKLGFHACEAQVASFDAESPSGHTSLSTTFYGSLTLLLAGGRKPWQRTPLYAAGILLIGLIGVSRVVTYAHTVSDVALGLVIGLLCIGVFQSLRGPQRPILIPYGRLLVGIPTATAVALLLLLAARHWTPEPFIAATAQRMNSLFDLCTPQASAHERPWMVLSVPHRAGKASAPASSRAAP